MPKARAKQGQPSIVLGHFLTPEYPEYFEVPAPYSAAVDALVLEGRLEYAPRDAEQLPPPAPPAPAVEAPVAVRGPRGFPARRVARQT